MKKLIYLLPIIGMFFISCDIEKEPYSQIEVDALFESTGALQSATLGNYAILKGRKDKSSWIDDMLRATIYPGDNLNHKGTTSDHYFFFYNYKNLATNYRTSRIWRDSYKTVVGCNVVIENAVEGETEELDQLLGENYYLRAYIYFQIGNVFGRPYNQGVSNLSVPLKLTSDVDDTPDRNTVGEVYAQVVSDLLKAEELMSVNKTAAFATREAAQALLSRVYLYMEEDGLAEEYATKVINSGRFNLLNTEDFMKYPTFNPEQNSETIFAITYTTESDYGHGWFTAGSVFQTTEGTGWGAMYASHSYLELLRENPSDARNAFINPFYKLNGQGEKTPWVVYVTDDYKYRTSLIYPSGAINYVWLEGAYQILLSEDVNGVTKHYFNSAATGEKKSVFKDFVMEKRGEFPRWFINKLSGQEGEPHLYSPVVSRLAEMFLNRAESNAKNGLDQEAIDDVNTIRERANIPLYTLGTPGPGTTAIPDGMTVLDVVLKERRIELAYEGHRKFDVFRNGRTMDRRYPGSHLWGANPFYEVPASHNRVVEFLPEGQITLQPSLIQNP